MWRTYLIYIAFLTFASCNTEINEQSVSSSSKTSNALLFHNAGKLLGLYKRKNVPESGEWLYEHKETAQSFEQYTRSKPVVPRKKYNTIYIQPLGNFSSGEEKLIKTTVEYLQVFFNLKVKVLNSKTISIVPDSATRKKFGSKQLKTGYILDQILLKNFPNDALVFECITNSDLYVNEHWNFVFGSAYLTYRTGVSSTYRFGKTFGDTTFNHLILRRFIQTISHELCHNLTMPHCVDFYCLMNGANSLEESDTQPLWLCPDCMKKLCWNLDYSYKIRFENLAKFFEKYSFNEEKEFCNNAIQFLQNQDNY